MKLFLTLVLSGSFQVFSQDQPPPRPSQETFKGTTLAVQDFRRSGASVRQRVEKILGAGKTTAIQLPQVEKFGTAVFRFNTQNPELVRAAVEKLLKADRKLVLLPTPESRGQISVPTNELLVRFKSTPSETTVSSFATEHQLVWIADPALQELGRWRFEIPGQPAAAIPAFIKHLELDPKVARATQQMLTLSANYP